MRLELSKRMNANKWGDGESLDSFGHDEHFDLEAAVILCEICSDSSRVFYAVLGIVDKTEEHLASGMYFVPGDVDCEFVADFFRPESLSGHLGLDYDGFVLQEEAHVVSDPRFLPSVDEARRIHDDGAKPDLDFQSHVVRQGAAHMEYARR